jgi:hypothetical protein
MDAPIPLKGVVLFIAFGSMVFIVVFCFVKRQITRFTLKSSQGPYSAIGLDAPKPLVTEIERRLKRVKDIMYEPPLLNQDMEERLLPMAEQDTSHFLYRMKAVDAVSMLYIELKKCGSNSCRKAGAPLKVFLLEQRQIGPLEGLRLDLIEKFCNSYDHARHDPKEFTKADYQQFMDLLNHLVQHVKTKHGCIIDDDSSSPTDATDKSDGSSQQLLSQKLNFPSSTLEGTTSPMQAGLAHSDMDVTYMPGTNSSQRMVNYALASTMRTSTGDLTTAKSDSAKAKHV